MMSWETFIKRYIWDDERTPYLVRVAKLTRRQADYEIFAYTLFLGLLYGLTAIVALSPAGGGRSELIALYAFSVVCAALIFSIMKSEVAGQWCAASSLVGAVIYAATGFGGGLGWIDHVLIAAFLAIWLRYSLRIWTLARTYPALTDPAPPTGMP
ncbi:MAG: hypothetical protein R3349_04355 [Geminicoccaceae bacterium]|nr:hypothetical protein [Geminicoccaceae bacterium]